MAKRIYQTVERVRAVDNGRAISLRFRAGPSGTAIPAVLQLPEDSGRAPAALLLHGWSARKETMAEAIGRVLLRHGVGSLAIDLPLHGERSDAAVLGGAISPLAIVGEWRAALAEGTLALRYLAAHGSVDGSALAIVGYSLGAYLALTLAADDPAARAVVLAAGGDLPAATPFTALVRPIADPLALVRRLEGRPLLMVHGREDRTVRPEQAERLFAAAAEPKEIHWWDAGHYLPPAAIERAAEWLAARLVAPRVS
jgi:dienelactone hydrolase